MLTCRTGLTEPPHVRCRNAIPAFNGPLMNVKQYLRRLTHDPFSVPHGYQPAPLAVTSGLLAQHGGGLSNTPKHPARTALRFAGPRPWRAGAFVPIHISLGVR